MRALWRVILEGARQEALLAVDLYNQPRHARRLEGFFVHMHLAWLYLLHAEFRRDHTDYRYRLPNGRFVRIDGEPKTWELAKCAEERWPEDSPIRKNLELTIALRNMIEHRYQEAVAVATAGYAQALLLNFEEELTSAFDPSYSLSDQLRFPVFVGSITSVGSARIEELRADLPPSTRNLLAQFESNLDSAVLADQRYEFRVHLVQRLGPRSTADRALSFVRADDLTAEQREVLTDLGRTGQVLVREQVRPVVSAGKMKPATAAARIQERIPFKFSVYSHFPRAWRRLKCRPKTGANRPERTDERYCLYDEPHGDYLYTPAFVEKVVGETNTKEKFEAFLGFQALPKAAS